VLKIYHVQGTRSVRPIWLCYELDLSLQIETIDFSQTYRDTHQWRAISPAGKVPVMTDTDTDAEVTLFESGAMVDFILERYANGRLHPPRGTAASAIHHQWCWFSEATLIRPLGLNRILRTPASGAESLAADGLNKTHNALQAVEQALQDRNYLLGAEFGAADIMMGYSLVLLEKFKLLEDKYPNTQRYLSRLKDRENFARAMQA